MLRLLDSLLVTLVEDPLLDPFAPDQAGAGENLQMLAGGGLADAQLFRNEDAADAILYKVAVLLWREMTLGVFQPCQDLQALFVGQGPYNAEFELGVQDATAQASISTRAPRGSAATASAVLAGSCSPKNSTYG